MNSVMIRLSCLRPLGYEGKIEGDRNQQQPVRTNNDECLRVSLLARLGCFRLEF